MSLKQSITSSKTFKFMRRQKGVVFAAIFIYVFADVVFALFVINRAVEIMQHFHHFHNETHLSSLKTEALIFITIAATVKLFMYYGVYIVSMKALSNEERLNQKPPLKK